MTGICTILAFASHFTGPAHSPRFLLALLILSFPTLLITLLAFLVDILLFIPHMAWGGWIVLAATILITACSLLTCAMRRLLVSRKARKKRIAENAEMNGQTYYETRAEQQFVRADSPPPLIVKPVNNGKAQFATFEVSRNPVQEDRVPLNAPQQPSPPSTTERSNPAVQTNGYRGTDTAVPMVAMATSNPPGREARRKERRTPPESPIDGQRSPASPSAMFNRDFPDARMAALVGPNGRGMGPRQGGPPGMVPRGRGFPQRGGMPPRGGFPSRGSYGRGAPQGMRGPPPPGWNGNRGGYPMGPGRGGPMMRGRGGPPPPGYPNRPYNGPPDGPGMRPDGRQIRPYGPTNPYMRRSSGGSRGPQQNHDGYLTDITQSPNIDENTNGGVPAVEAPADEYAPGRVFSMYSQPGGATGEVNNNNVVDTARETNGVVVNGQSHNPLTYIFGNPHEIADHENIQLPRLETNSLPKNAVEMDAAGGSPLRNHTSHHTPISPVEMGMPASPRHQHQTPYATSPTHNHTASPIELPTAASQPTSPTSPTDPNHVHPALRTRSHTASETYYEDVDPRFASDDPTSTIGPLPPADASTSAPRQISEPRIPSYIARQRHLLNPGTGSTTSSFYADPNAPMDPADMENGDDDNAASRARSPAASETSNFTSVSQRGINPNWRPVGAPPPGAAYNNGSQFTSRGGGGAGGAGGRWKGEAMSNLSILEANPDFMLPGVGGRGRGAGGRSAAMGGGSMIGGGPGMGSPTRSGGVAPGMLGVGRYPTDV